MKAAVLVILATLAFATNTQASESARMTFHPTVSPLVAAEQAAVAYWHSFPCSGHVTVRFGVLNATILGGPEWARASALTTHIENVYTDCVITIDRTYWSRAERSSDFPDFCALMVHEFGHFFGYWDDPKRDPRTSIKYPLITQANEYVRPCVNRYHFF